MRVAVSVWSERLGWFGAFATRKVRFRIGALLAILALALLPQSVRGMEQTCAGCIQSCCEWSLAAREEGRLHHFVRIHSKIPVPCADLAAKHGPYAPEVERCEDAARMRCLRSNCSGCANTYASRTFWLLPLVGNLLEAGKFPGHHGVGGSKPIRLAPGQVIVVPPKLKQRAQ